MKQREALITRKRNIFSLESTDTADIESDEANRRFMRECKQEFLIDIEIAAIDERIAKYRAVADKLLNNIQNPSKLNISF